MTNKETKDLINDVFTAAQNFLSVPVVHGKWNE